jgi:ATP-binding cassette subfamily B (MDR/TAP) protein 1
MKEADEKDTLKEAANKATLENLIDPKKQNGIFKKKINEHNKPVINIIIGTFLSLCIGCVYPIFGAFMIKCIFTLLMVDPNDRHSASKNMNPYALWMFIIACSLLVTVTLRAIVFGYISENVTMNIRKDLYQSVMRKHMGWHDDRRNNSGVIASMLSGECSHLQGLSSEALGVMIESMFALVSAILIAFIFSWQMALICLGLTPLMIISSLLSATADQGVKRTGDKEESELLASDVIANFRTVASFGSDKIIIDKYRQLN